MFGFGKKTVTVEINRVRTKLTADQVKAIYMEMVQATRKVEELEAKFDEAARKAFVLAAENKTLKDALKNYGHPGL